ncbi:importin subunit alpha-4 [Anaeramoeba flamelloides]|uniref:Importin subunit alpha n=1 Tax=Anaeramoeba flamelloides TaxID=1746091 RepID=A0AAV7YLQ2_9EUKA|nr:importin subunit alpha-4 [Anaeramoeba flamelloides]
MSNFEKKLKRRQARFKPKSTKESTFEKRYDTSIQISKKKRAQNLRKRRNISSVLKNKTNSLFTDEEINKKLKNLPFYTKSLQSNDRSVYFPALREIRILLSLEKNPPLDKVIELGATPYLVEFLRCDNDKSLQYEAVWCLTNIASGTPEQTKLIVDLETIPIFVKLLDSENEAIQEQSVWALGNIAGDCIEYRDLVLSYNVIEFFLKIFKTKKRVAIIKTTTWSLYNLCSGKPRPKFELIKPAISILAKLVKVNHRSIVVDACWAISCISEGSDKYIQAILDTEICPTIVELLKMKSLQIRAPALRCIGNFVTGNDKQTDIVLECDVLPTLKDMILTGSSITRKEACWAISNICAGVTSQIHSVIIAGFVPILLKILKQDIYPVQKEAAWGISNMIYGGLPTHVRFLVKYGVIARLCDLLTIKDQRILKATLESIEKILRLGKQDAEAKKSRINASGIEFEAAGGYENIQKLLQHQSPDVYRRASFILLHYSQNNSDSSSLSDDDDDDYDEDEVSEEDNFRYETNFQEIKSFSTQNQNSFFDRSDQEDEFSDEDDYEDEDNSNYDDDDTDEENNGQCIKKLEEEEF